MLDVDERTQLAHELLDSLESEWASPEVEAAWIAEAQRCVQLIDRGEMTTMSAEDVHAGLPIPDET